MRRLLPLLLFLVGSVAHGGFVIVNPSNGLRPKLANLHAGWTQGRLALHFGRPEGLNARIALPAGQPPSVWVGAGDAAIWSWPQADR